jgi:hypothetical protein
LQTRAGFLSKRGYLKFFWIFSLLCAWSKQKSDTYCPDSNLEVRLVSVTCLFLSLWKYIVFLFFFFLSIL